MSTYEVKQSDGDEFRVEADAVERTGANYTFTDEDGEIVADVKEHTVERVVRVDARAEE